MIKGNTSTAFKFIKFRISNFSFEESESNEKDLRIEFNPKGKYNEKLGTYELILNFKAFNDKANGNLVMNVTSISEFTFDKSYNFSELPAHFFSNSIPIVFPYLRAFISTLTLQANSDVIMIGLINFTNMADPLKANTEIVNTLNT